MSTPAGWYADPADPRVQRFWTGSTWTAQRVWTGTQWVDPAAVPPPPGVGTLRPRRLWWVMGLLVAVGVVVVAIAIAAGGGDSGGTASRQTFCSDLGSALSGLYQGNVVKVVHGGSSDPYTDDETANMRAAISSAERLAKEAPDPPKRYLQGLARGLSANLAGRVDLNAEDDVDVQLGQLNAWHAVNCA
jgi:hypothetical protein